MKVGKIFHFINNITLLQMMLKNSGFPMDDTELYVQIFYDTRQSSIFYEENVCLSNLPDQNLLSYKSM